MKIIIDYRFTTLNEYIDTERANKFAAAKIKERDTHAAQLAANGKESFMVYPVKIVCHWFLKSTRTDPDNIAFGIKFILDGFVKAGLLKGDGWKFIKSITHEFSVDTQDYVIVYLEA